MTQIYQSYSPIVKYNWPSFIWPSVIYYPAAILQCIFTIFHSFRHEILLKTKQSGLIYILFHSMAILYMYEW